ncbi:MAG TPA: ATP-dependent DNA helicase RecQ [Cyclobacteriaceae bacterium]|nr:ATP-dependent DNA helicase RecQ [Cyclobacteriaceae bacterium]
MVSPESILKQYWGHDHFRLPQREIIQAAVEGKDVLALLPTGGGKSVCFQVPGLMLEGITIVVSPLIALMQDQVQQLKARNIPALAVYSGMGRNEIDIALDNAVYGKFKFLYVSPERLKTEMFLERFKKMKVSLVAIDEAHCISQWGYDFRPPYLEIHKLREIKPGVRFMALTATATKEVKQDIIDKLRMRSPLVFQKSFSRDNLAFVVRKTEDKERKLVEVLRNVPGTAVVYMRSRKATVDIARYLEQQGISSTYYHAGLSHSDRMIRQEAWISNQKRVMVATNAFGMGIDKADVRVVVHLDLPENLEAYYQEAGRAGRDGKKSYAAVLYHDADVSGLRTKVQQAHPTPDYLKKIYQGLANYFQLAEGSGEGESFEFDLDAFCSRFGFRAGAAFAALKKLEEEGLILLSESFYRPSRAHVQSDKTRLYEFQVANEKFDAVIKALLRVHGSDLFTEFIPIAESKIGHALKINETQVAELLKQLAQLQVISYEPSSEKPQITFISPRQDANRLSLNLKRIEERWQLAESKMEAMIDFAEQQRRCRMQVMLDYFGESTFDTCGQCDVCVARKKKDQGDSFMDYEQRVTNLLEQQPMTVDELERRINPDDRHLFIEVVRELVDQGILAYDAYWVLHKK